MAGCAGIGNMAGCAGIENMAGCAGIGCADCMAGCAGMIGRLRRRIEYTAKIAAPCISCRQELPVSRCQSEALTAACGFPGGF